MNHCKSTCRGLLVRPGDLLASELVCPAGSLMLFLTSFLLKEYWLTNVLKVVAKKFFLWSKSINVLATLEALKLLNFVFKSLE